MTRAAIETLYLHNGLQFNRRRSAGRGPERRHRSAEAHQGRLAELRKKERKLSLPASAKSSLQLNYIGISYN